MAESKAQKRQRVMQEQIAAARERGSGGTREEVTASNLVSPPAQSSHHEFSQGYNLTHHNRPMRDNRPRREQQHAVTAKVIKRQQPAQNGDARTYQKHVLFAIVCAFLVRAVAVGKLSG